MMGALQCLSTVVQIATVQSASGAALLNLLHNQVGYLISFCTLKYHKRGLVTNFGLNKCMDLREDFWMMLLVYLELQMRLCTMFLVKKFAVLSCAQFAIIVLETLNHALPLPNTCFVTYRQQLWLGTVLCGLC